MAEAQSSPIDEKPIFLTLNRIYNCDAYCIGKLSIDGVYFCDTLEDTDRGLTSDMSVSEIESKKIYGKTAIPRGTYSITLSVVSPKFSQYSFYMNVCDGKLPRLLDVKGFDGILLHVADGYQGADLVNGCIGVGKNTVKGQLSDGKNTFTKLYNKLKKNPIGIQISIQGK